MTSSFHPSLPQLSPLLPKPKSESLTKPNCSKIFSQQQTNINASPLPSSSQLKASSTMFFERPRTEKKTLDKATSTRLQPSSLKMKKRAKQLRLLSGKVLSTECGVGFRSVFISPTYKTLPVLKIYSEKSNLILRLLHVHLILPSQVHLSMMGLAKLQWQASRLGYSLALTPARGKLIVMPKFNVVHNV